jgi:circadian clock protein KaiB
MPHGSPLQLLLFVRANAARSVDAIRSVRKACDADLTREKSLQVVDVFREPELAMKYRVIATPTLLSLNLDGKSELRLVGDVSEGRVRDYFVAEAAYGV